MSSDGCFSDELGGWHGGAIGGFQHQSFLQSRSVKTEAADQRAGVPPARGRRGRQSFNLGQPVGRPAAISGLVGSPLTPRSHPTPRFGLRSCTNAVFTSRSKIFHVRWVRFLKGILDLWEFNPCQIVFDLMFFHQKRLRREASLTGDHQQKQPVVVHVGGGGLRRSVHIKARHVSNSSL